MRPCLCVCIWACLAFTLLADDKPPEGWKEFKGGPRTQGFSVWFPPDNKIDESEDTISAPKSGQIKVHRAVNKGKDGLVLGVWQLQLPSTMSKMKPKDRQEYLRDMFLEEVNGKVTEEKKLDLGTMSGTEYLVQTKDGMARLQLFGTNVGLQSQVYRMTAVGTKEQVSSKEVDSFFESFKRVTGGRVEARTDPKSPSVPPRTDPRPPPVVPPRVTANAGIKGIPVPQIGGAVMLPDRNTLLIGSSGSGCLIFFDTVAEKETKRVDLDFKPGPMVMYGDKLYVAVDGAASVRVLDPATGKETASIKLPGEPLRALACHPSKGLIYGTTPSYAVVAIDPAKEMAASTHARGGMIAVDPIDGKYVYTGIQGQIKDGLAVTKTGNGTVVVQSVMTGTNAVMGKFEVRGNGTDLKLLKVNNNAAVNGNQMAIRSDGKVVAMSGGGGWKDKGGGGYVVAAFETNDLASSAGQMDVGPYPSGIAFHPDLPLAAVYKNHDDVIVFSAKSFAKKQTHHLDRAGNCHSILFGAGGTKAIFLSIGGGADPLSKEGKVTFLPLELTDEDKKALSEAEKK